MKWPLIKGKGAGPSPARYEDIGSPRVLRAVAVGYIGLMIVLPIAALSGRAFGDGFGAFWQNLTRPDALYSLQLTLLMALAMVVVNVVMGTLMAWVLIRYEFPGQSVVNALIDLPFAIPTVVTGLMLVVLYGPQSAVGRFLTANGVEVIYAKPGIVLALLFVTLPFVVRSVQPVLMGLDKEMEEAAATLGANRWVVFRKVIVPSILPAVLTGAALSFSRAIGEFGSVVIVAGNIPMRTQVASVFIYGEVESDNPQGALGVSIALLALSLLVLVVLYLLQRVGRSRDA